MVSRSTRPGSQNFKSALDSSAREGGYDHDEEAPVKVGQTLPMEAVTSVGAKLGELRRQAGYTQIEIAVRMKTTQPTLARLEKGDGTPNLTTIERYAAALGRKVRVRLHGPGGCKNRGLDENSVQTLDLGHLIEELVLRRKAQGFTQSRVATDMLTTQPMVARLERGDASPNLRTLERYASALKLQLELNFDLLENDERR